MTGSSVIALAAASTSVANMTDVAASMLKRTTSSCSAERYGTSGSPASPASDVSVSTCTLPPSFIERSRWRRPPSTSSFTAAASRTRSRSVSVRCTTTCPLRFRRPANNQSGAIHCPSCSVRMRTRARARTTATVISSPSTPRPLSVSNAWRHLHAARAIAPAILSRGIPSTVRAVVRLSACSTTSSNSRRMTASPGAGFVRHRANAFFWAAPNISRMRSASTIASMIVTVSVISLLVLWALVVGRSTLVPPRRPPRGVARIELPRPVVVRSLLVGLLT